MVGTRRHGPGGAKVTSLTLDHAGTVSPTAGRHRRVNLASSQKAATLSLRNASPHTVLDPAVERVVQALGSDRTTMADLYCLHNSSAVTRKEDLRPVTTAAPRNHPRRPYTGKGHTGRPPRFHE